MPRRFEVLINPQSGLVGDLVAIIDSDRVRREGSDSGSESDSPPVPVISPPVQIDTRTPITTLWDVPDEVAMIAGEEIEVGIDFGQNVVLPDGRDLEEAPAEWLRMQGIEIPFNNIRVTPLREDDPADEFDLRISELPTEKLENDAEFSFVLRTTFNELLATAPTQSAVTLSSGSVTGVCQIVCRQSYRFTAETPDAGEGTITITANSAGFSVLSANRVMGSVMYGVPLPLTTQGFPTTQRSHNSCFTFTIRCDPAVTATPSRSDLSVTNGTVVSLTEVTTGTTYRATIRVPASGTGTTTVTALATGWTNIDTDQVLGSVAYG